jgi:hypothetical protein
MRDANRKIPIKRIGGRRKAMLNFIQGAEKVSPAF